MRQLKDRWLNIRISRTTDDVINHLVAVGKWESRSDVVRDAVARLAEQSGVYA